MKIYASIFIFLFIPFLLLAQDNKLKVSGAVYKTGTEEHIIDVLVKVKNSTTGTVTDVNDNHIIEAVERDILVYSYIGFVNREITVE